jgi:3-deoxy-D-manno-octulosonic-acid transferase
LARERFGAEFVFFYPLDIGWGVRAYLKALRPRMLVLMESELWPRMLVECSKSKVPVAVVNARISDRSFPRYMRLRRLWRPFFEMITLFLAQDRETADRLIQIGAPAERVKVMGNLKYDVRAPKQSRVAELIRTAVGERPLVVAGSTVEGKDNAEEPALMEHWASVLRVVPEAVMVVAPRHPERFDAAYAVMKAQGTVRATELLEGTAAPVVRGGNILLDTIGDLAAVYGLADVAFVGGSLVPKGGHNPLEPAQFGVPVVMGPSYENFRDVVERMRTANGIVIVDNREGFEQALVELLTNREKASEIGKNGREVFEAQAGATAASVNALMGLLQDTPVIQR